MALFVSILILLIAAVLLTRLAWSLSVPYPSLLALGGAALALLPGTPLIVLDPSLALAIFVAPVLLDAAYDTSLRDLSDNRLPIILLVVMAVGLTTAARCRGVPYLRAGCALGGGGHARRHCRPARRRGGDRRLAAGPHAQSRAADPGR